MSPRHCIKDGSTRRGPFPLGIAVFPRAFSGRPASIVGLCLNPASFIFVDGRRIGPCRAVLLAASLLLAAVGAVVSGEPAPSGDAVEAPMEGADCPVRGSVLSPGLLPVVPVERRGTPCRK